MDNIDKQIAEKVMGWEAPELHGFWWDETNYKFEKPVCKDGKNPLNAWRPSTNIAHAFEVVEKMKESGWYLNGLHALEGHDVDWEAVFERNGDIEFADADTPAMAICLAALACMEA